MANEARLFLKTLRAQVLPGGHWTSTPAIPSGNHANYVKAPEAAAILLIGLTSFKRVVKQGLLAKLRHGGRIWYLRAECEALRDKGWHS